MKVKLLNILSILLWLPALVIKFVIFDGIGLVAVLFTDSSHPIWGNNEDPKPRSWYKPNWSKKARNYGWRALRNRSNNLRYRFKEPTPTYIYGTTNPEVAVRSGTMRKASRFTRASLYSEYWVIWKTESKSRPYGEFRIGWKFSGVPGFMITGQLRRGK